MGKTPREIPYERIIRGRIYNAAIPHTFGRPLKFVEPHPKIFGVFNVVEKNDGFEGVIDSKTGKRVAPVVQAIAEFKMRPAVVIQADEWNKKEEYPFVIVLPIQGIYPDDLKDPDIKRMIAVNDLPFIHYIGSIPGKESYITITKPNRLNKNMLYLPKNEIDLSSYIMEEILKKLPSVMNAIKTVKSANIS